MRTRTYDAIVVGASFAGLAVARQLRGRVLLLDRHEVGAVQTSACATPLWVAQALGVERSVLQVHRAATVHTPTRAVRIDISDLPYCTFDYRAFCCGLLEQAGARFLRTPVRGLRDGAVETGAGRFEAPCVVDASGWRGVLVRGEDAVPAGPVSFGLETEVSHRDEGLHFWAASASPTDLFYWLFPVGPASRIGVASYEGGSKLVGPLVRFMGGLGLAPTAYHGTYFTSGLRAPTVGRVFAVGDAAGQCLPFTGEGIRPALYFGELCGRLVRWVVDGRLPLDAALEAYRAHVRAYRSVYRRLAWAQAAAMHAPRRSLGLAAELACRPAVWRRWWPGYAGLGRLAASLPPPPRTPAAATQGP